MQPETFDVLVVGAGPAGSCAARTAALGRARVLLVEKRRQVGLPVQCAEYVPWQLAHQVPIPPRCIAQTIRQMRTVLPDGTTVDKPAGGMVLGRALWDKHLAVLAHQAGAELRTEWTATAYDGREVLLRHGPREARIRAQVIVGADGPHSTVAGWVGQSQSEFVHGVEVEVVLPELRDQTEIYFAPLYRGGYGWLFPKGETANVGVAVNVRMGGQPGPALDHLLDRLGLSRAAVVGTLGGAVPVGGPVAEPRAGEILLVGDAAGLAHPVTGAGIAPAVLSGQMAGEAAAQAVAGQDLAALERYPLEWEARMGAPLRQAVANRRHLDAHWTDDPAALSERIRETWIAFPAYGRRKSNTEAPRG
ncbi:MAG: geranylgeranyl reductase family protein [Anaerolineae bacterium]|nr:geranylgeranyl reductase family protein [Anaerolineae bacterium]